MIGFLYVIKFFTFYIRFQVRSHNIFMTDIHMKVTLAVI